MRLGVAGLGRMGTLHARNLRANGASLVVYDADPAAGAMVSAANGADVASSVEELLEPKLDGLVVATSTPSHAALVRKALQARIPVFCEKPISAKIAESVSIVHLAERLGIPVQVGFQRRSDPELRALRARIQEGTDGSLIGVRVISSSWRPPPPEYVHRSGGLFRDKIAHELDLVRWLTGREIEEVAVTASGAATGWIGELGDADTASISIVISGGVIGQIWVSRMSPTRFDLRVEVVCGHRVLVAGSWDQGDRPALDLLPSPWPDFMERFQDAYLAEIESFLLLLAGDAHNICAAPDALGSEIAAVAAEQAWRDMRVVRVAELTTRLGACLRSAGR